MIDSLARLVGLGDSVAARRPVEVGFHDRSRGIRLLGSRLRLRLELAGSDLPRRLEIRRGEQHRAVVLIGPGRIRVEVDGEGNERVQVHRRDGHGIATLKATGLPLLVLSAETNDVVRRRCEKLGVPCLSGVRDKPARLVSWMRDNDVQASGVVYVGDDQTDETMFALQAEGHIELHTICVGDGPSRARWRSDISGLRKFLEALRAQICR